MRQTGLGLPEQSPDASRIGQQLAASVGEAHTLSTAVEQACTQPLLEFTNRTAQRWLGQVQRLGGLPEAQRVGHGQEECKRAGFQA